MDLQNEWNPPEKNGLTNSDPIIPLYYLKTIVNEIDGNEEEIKLIKIKYIDVIKDDIRNLRKLNKYQLSFVKYNLSKEDKNDII